MVLLKIKLRPQRGYTYPGAVREAEVDSSLRLENLLANFSIGKKGTRLFLRGIEVPLNSSLATHNVRDNDIIETCSSAFLSAVLSALISDLEAIQKIQPEEDRTKEKICPLLDSPSLQDEDWEAHRWSHDHVKRRSIFLKLVKKILQRNDRFANTQVPQCEDLQSLYDFIRESRVLNKNGGFSTMEQCFKPSARNRGGRPTLTWELLQHKLDKYLSMASAHSGSDDLIEAFVKAENARHQEEATVLTPRRRLARSKSTRSQRELQLSATKQSRVCAMCQTAPADCLCLESDCPFQNKLSCFACFAGNHPVHLRNHESIPLADRRAKAVLRKTERKYCPEYASGPFVVLSTLYEYSTKHHELSLTEKRLKELAQPRCRANLYDRQARGRTAFSCIEKLSSEGYIRKEIIANVPEGESGKYSLLPKGEALARRCYEFGLAMDSALDNEDLNREREMALDKTTNRNHVSLVVDTREDSVYRERFVSRCRTDGRSCFERELPAGDYLFVTKKGRDELVLPLVVERKTWSDLADSVTGRGRRRLDCVRIGAFASCNSKCQLCRMKRSQCPKIMFIVEGARCLARDGNEDKCTDEKRCMCCKELKERHNLTQSDLEEVLCRLQVEHQCLVHFTRDYNETITSMFILADILAAGSKNADPDLAQGTGLAAAGSKGSGLYFPLKQTYIEFCSNAHRSAPGAQNAKLAPRGDIHEIYDADFIASINKGRAASFLSDELGVRKIPPQPVEAPVEKPSETPVEKPSEAVQDLEIIDIDESEDCFEILNESQDSIQILEDDGWTSTKKLTKKVGEMKKAGETVKLGETINLLDSDSDSDSDLDLDSDSPLEQPASNGPGKRKNDSISSSMLKRARLEPRKTHLFLLSGLYHYDHEYFQDCGKVWKNLFAGSSSDSSDFEQTAKHHIKSLQGSTTPFIKRSHIIFWILFSQLRHDIVLYSAQQTVCADKLKSRWQGTAATPPAASPGQAIPATPQTRGTLPSRNTTNRTSPATPEIRREQPAANATGRATPTAPRARNKRQSPGATSAGKKQPKTTSAVKECVICCEALGRKNVEAIPCGHCFHRECLQTWWSSSAPRSCPTCKFSIPAPAEAIGANCRPPRASNAPTRALFVGDQRMQGSGNREVLRNARLRRFEVPAPSRAEHSPPTNPPENPPPTGGLRWSCKKCTFENEASSSKCDMCDEARPSGGDRGVAARPEEHRFSTSPDPTTQVWECDKCTFENSASDAKCGICQADNPSFVGNSAVLPQNPVQPSGKTSSRLDATDSSWACSRCTKRNSAAQRSCDVCGADNPQLVIDKTEIQARKPSPSSVVTSASAQARIPQSARISAPKRGKCGACGGFGHNRGNYTAATCPMYNEESEKEFRRKKREKQEEKLRDTQQQITELETRQAAGEEQMKQLAALVSEVQRNQKVQDTAARRELRRLQKAKERAQKRARQSR